MKLCIVVATARDGAIGYLNDLPWRIPEELRWFRKLTEGQLVAFGRNTWESLPRRPLPGRQNIVISSRAPGAWSEGAEVFPSLEAVAAAYPGQEIMVAGGAELYRTALPVAERMLLTTVETDFPVADTRFPDWHIADWRPGPVLAQGSTPLRWTCREYQRRAA